MVPQLPCMPGTLPQLPLQSSLPPAQDCKTGKQQEGCHIQFGVPSSRAEEMRNSRGSGSTLSTNPASSVRIELAACPLARLFVTHASSRYTMSQRCARGTMIPERLVLSPVAQGTSKNAGDRTPHNPCRGRELCEHRISGYMTSVRTVSSANVCKQKTSEQSPALCVKPSQTMSWPGFIS